MLPCVAHQAPLQPSSFCPADLQVHPLSSAKHAHEGLVKAMHKHRQDTLARQAPIELGRHDAARHAEPTIL